MKALTKPTSIQKFIDNVNGRVAVPILMYLVGFPGMFCVLVWLFFFKGK